MSEYILFLWFLIFILSFFILLVSLSVQGHLVGLFARPYTISQHRISSPKQCWTSRTNTCGCRTILSMTVTIGLMEILVNKKKNVFSQLFLMEILVNKKSKRIFPFISDGNFGKLKKATDIPTYFRFFLYFDFDLLSFFHMRIQWHFSFRRPLSALLFFVIMNHRNWIHNT